MANIKQICNQLITNLISSFSSVLQVETNLRYTDDFVFDNPRDIVDKNYVDNNSGSGTTLPPFDETVLVNATGSGIDYWYIPLTLANLGTKRPYYTKINGVQNPSIYYDENLEQLIGFDDPSVTTTQTIKVYTI